MSALKGVILGIDHVLVVKGTVDPKIVDEIGRLIRFLLAKGVTPVVLANHEWVVSGKDQAKTPLREILVKTWGEFPWFTGGKDGVPRKPTAAATAHVLAKMGWAPTEVVYLGNSEADMRTAVNGQLLFLNAVWYGKNCDYGFEFQSTKDVARFVDLFCLRTPTWHFEIHSGSLNFCALAPYSTMLKEFEAYSTDAKNAAKFGAGHPDFWTKYLWSTIYFSGLHQQIDYIAPYPGHKVGHGSKVMDDPMGDFAKCFRKQYLPDLIVRHKLATKSAYARKEGKDVDVLNQLNSIHLSRLPMKGVKGEPYKNSPLSNGKTVLVVDDICTQGHSLEAVRVFIEQTNARAISLSWLKTINTSFEQLGACPKFDPYTPVIFAKPPDVTVHPYKSTIADPHAAKEIQDRLAQYDGWDWPADGDAGRS